MKTVLFAWELGAGLGHLTQMLPLAEDLARAGHRVYVAARNLGGAASVFARAGVWFLPAAFKTEGPSPYPRCSNYAHILAHHGWHSEASLFGIACAWRNLMGLVKPDLVVFDHSPAALLASRGLPLRRVVMGTGFFCPPDVSPFPALRQDTEPRQLAVEQQQVLERANAVLAHWKEPPLAGLGGLFADADETLLVTFPELDHYGRREGVRYWGPVLGSGSVSPCWPAGDGKRVYAYLKASAGVEDVLAELAARKLPTLVYAMGIGPEVRQRFESARMRFETRPLDMAAVAREADLAVLNANHGTLCHLLLGGKPLLMLPLHLEQQALARPVAEIGAGEVAATSEGGGAEFGGKLDAVLGDASYAGAAGAFAARHGDFAPRRQRREMLERVGRLMSEGFGTASTPHPTVRCHAAHSA